MVNNEKEKKTFPPLPGRCTLVPRKKERTNEGEMKKKVIEIQKVKNLTSKPAN